MKKIFIFLLLIFMSNVSFVNSSDATYKDIILRESLFKIEQGAVYKILNVSINKNQLKVLVEFRGGLKKHSFNLFASAYFLESNPVQTDYVITHDSNGDNGEKLIRETLQFNLLKLKESYILGYRKEHGTIIININRSQNNSGYRVEYNF